MAPIRNKNKKLHKTREEVYADLINKYKTIAPAPSAPGASQPKESLPNKTYRVINPVSDYQQPSLSPNQETIAAYIVETTPATFATNNNAKQYFNVADIFSAYLNVHNTQEFVLGTPNNPTEEPNYIYLVTSGSQLVPEAVQISNAITLHILNSNQVNSALRPKSSRSDAA